MAMLQIRTSKSRHKSAPPRTFFHLTVSILLQFLFTFAQGQGPGVLLRHERAVDDQVTFSILEEQIPGTLVGTIPTRDGFTYRMNNANPSYFILNATTGRITTAVRLDRESLKLRDDQFDYVILSSYPVYPIEVHIKVLDVNDNSPVFPNRVVNISFSETADKGTQVILDTATDADIGVNSVTSNYAIVSGNEDKRFRLVISNDPSLPFLHIENTEKLDREEKSNYILNISAEDGGDPKHQGYVLVNITVLDFNDKPPIFDHSDYTASVNESLPIGSSIIKVRATDQDIGQNQMINYAIIAGDENKQFYIEPTTGEISTLKKLSCYRECDPGNPICLTKSCRITIEARDKGMPYLTGTAYLNVNLLDENDHNPSIRFRYKSPGQGNYGTVNEGAIINQVVAVVSVTDQDDGMNGQTAVELVSGHHDHFKLDTIFNLVRVSGTLDRERISKYNITVIARDGGTPQRSSTAFLILYVNDINDHPPVFEHKEYSAKLSELVSVGSFVAGITANDNDTGINALIKYTIVSGNDLGWFKIDNRTGLVTTNKPLDREKTSHLELRIKAQDGASQPYEAYTKLIVDIWDENDEIPSFPKKIYNISFEEGAKAGTEIISLTAVDNDLGKNGTVQYYLAPDVQRKYPDMFQLAANSGRILTRKALDREVEEMYVIHLGVRDEGTPPKSSTATIYLNVTDINDNSPVFYPVKYHARVVENEPAHTSVIRVLATDADKGANAVIYYSISDGADQKFAIDIRTGWISTTQKLDREQKSLYRLTVTATDLGNRVADTPAIVEVTVNDVQDTPPVFSKVDGYSFSILEDSDDRTASTGRRVGVVRARSADISASISYSIVGGDQEGVFTVDSTTGIVSNVKKIDREQKSFYSLTVIANGGNVYGETTVNITILDVNDNTPRFPSNTVDAYVVENWPVGHEVVNVAASDPDFGPNSRITYTLIPDADNTFRVDESTGVIYLNKPVNYGTSKSFSIKVTATDSGTPQKSQTVSVNVIVRDINDHTPMFKQTSYEVTISESRPVNDRFFSVTAQDSDAGLNGEIIYNITKGNSGSSFGVFPDGVLYVKKKLDRETRDLYIITIMAKDKGVEPRSSSVNVTIHIQDANDNKPLFRNATYEMFLVENKAANTYIGSVSATDVDVGRNAELTYMIQTTQNDFAIHPKTGAIRSLVTFDREQLLKSSGQDYLALTIAVMDGGVTRLTDTCTVNIHITDVNDNPPKFSRSAYDASLYENAPQKTLVIKVNAVDNDMMGQTITGVTYSILDGNSEGQFAIDAESGQITLVSTLNREIKDNYQLTVMAKDSGVPTLNNTAIVKILVLDSNDNAPVFTQTEQSFDLLETTQPGEFIIQFSAIDEDIGNNALITYSIASGNTDNTFSIDTNTGKLYLAKDLDYETKKQFTLMINATDFGSPRLSTSLKFVVNVRDFNDNAPAFISSQIVVRIDEGINRNSPVYTITATDPDSGVNGELRYQISKQKPDGYYFAINAITGEIYTNGTIDREFSPTFELTVRATDQAIPASKRRWAEKLVTVIIQDINDHAPQFVSMSSAVVSENTPANTNITTIRAVDPDSGDSGRVTYSVTGGNTNLFRIDPIYGHLYSKVTLSPSSITYDLTIMARDNAPSPLSNTMQFTVLTASSQTQGLFFTSTNYQGQVYENMAIGTTVLAVTASDSSNPNTRIEYYITEIKSKGVQQNHYFTIDRNSGIISTAQELDRENGYDLFTLDVYAVDRGSTSPRSTKTQVTVSLLDKNDSPPRFEPAIYSLSIPENIGIDRTVATVTATDADKSGTIRFSIDQGNDGKFLINPSTGVIKTIGDLDRETQATYSLKVRANDGAQSSYAIVNINITDINDEEPVFLQPRYSFDIPEDMVVGTTVGRISATDADSNKNGQVTLSIMSLWGRDKFSLDSQNGVFILMSRLDAEQVNHYVLTVRATDSGTPQQTSTVIVYMNVIDKNDNAPVFDPSSYNNEVWENVTIGTSVLTVTASDMDSGKNGEVKYTITGGDPENQFQINENNGTISTTKLLDREEQAFYNLYVTARDQAPQRNQQLSSSALVTIILKDVNDNSPDFVSSNYTEVSENTAIGTSVFKVVATDKDEGRNGYVEYSLSGNRNGIFTLGTVDGLLRVNAKLDREAVQNYTLMVTATDKGVPPKSTTRKLFVKIADENDNSPVFSPNFYSATVNEDLKVGTSLLDVLATDADEGTNAEIRYFIVEDDDNNDFRMDPYVGELSTQKSLDYERKKSYQLRIQAQDQGEDPKSHYAIVNITVLDINDCPPKFINAPYRAYVQENSVGLPVHVLKVSARDDDSPRNSIISYSISDGDKSIFKINSSTGEIKAYKSLNREETSKYELTVVGTDSGSPRLTGTGTVTVYVQDVNDNPPIFQRTHYVGHVLEKEAAPYSAVKVTATDKDADHNALIRYSLLDSIDNKFTIFASTGEIVTTAMLDREERDRYSLVVMATDNGRPAKLSSTVAVTIIVDDANDNTPQFERRSYSIYIRDPTSKGEFVLGVTASDRDIGTNGEIAYSLFGQDASKFNVNPSNGVIRSARELSGRSGGYRFNVRATDKGQNPLTDEVSVEVRFLPENTLGFPVINPGVRGFSLSENVDVQHRVTTVTATSPRGAPLTYHIAGGNVGQVFDVDSDSGLVKIKKNLDYEEVKSFSLWIEARDNSNPALSGFAELAVRVLDENDNAPVFEKLVYNTSIMEEGSYGTTVAVVTATDADSENNGRLTYQFKDGAGGDTFDIGSAYGVIKTKMSLDREKIGRYTLVVEAVDHGTPRITATATVDVTVLDKNDHPPRFTRHFNTKIPENSPIGAFVVRITSTDADIGSNAIHTYSFSENPDNKFAIDSKSGNVTVAGSLDRERKQDYELRVRTTDGAFVASTTIRIEILDTNDNAPHFKPRNYQFNFTELQKASTFIGKVSATDDDSPGPNSQVFYTLKTPTKYFKLDAEDGNLYSREVLKYKSTSNGPISENQYHLTIVAMDRGETPLSSSTDILIKILPANQYPPVFGNTTYFAPVAETTATGTSVLTVKAVDERDFGSNAEIEYFIQAGNGSNYLAIHRYSGEITLINPVGRLTSQSLYLRVKAQDRGSPPKFAFADVTIPIAPTNNYAPQFTSSVFSVEIPENKQVGSVIATVTATDRDVGPNGQVSFYITGGDADNEFSIDESLGHIRVQKPLDFETTKVHKLTVTARDRGFLPREKSVFFTVTVSDVNDNPPLFNQTVYHASIRENSPSGTSIFQAKAEDADIESNAIIEYLITGDVYASSKFTIDRTQGIIRSQGSIDYELRQSYDLHIRAVNPGTTMMGNTKVTIAVTGVNEFIPQFSQRKYSFIVSESAKPNYRVGAVSATDADKGLEGKVYYYLIGDSNLKRFTINENTGVIFVSKQLDRESASNIILRVLAKNYGPIRGNDTDECEVRVSIQDANDPPIFTQPLFEGTVREDASLGTSVVTVSANDNDLKPEYSQFKYKILNGNEGYAFRINADSGVIATNATLNREGYPIYNLTVGAIDSGIPPQTGTTQVKIYLTDANDNGPYFIPSIPTGYVLENKGAFTSVMNLVPYTHDPDLPPNRGPYNYKLLSHQNLFELASSSGVIQTKASLDRENTPSYMLTLEVKDNGVPTQSSTLSVRVVVNDTNDNPSTPRALSIVVNTYQGVFASGKIADVRPSDKDLVGDYLCSIVKGDQSVFSIPSGCNLHARNVKDAQQYELNLSGHDGIHKTVYSTMSVEFRPFTSATLDNTLDIHLSNVTAGDFVKNSYVKFLSTIKNLVSGSDAVVILGLNRLGDDLQMFLAARQPGGTYVYRSTLARILENNRITIENQAGVKFAKINHRPCSQSDCQNGAECIDTISIGTSYVVSESESFVFTSPKSEHDYKCTCRQGTTGKRCETTIDQCKNGPCRNGGTCFGVDGNGYSCVCAAGYTGQNCESDVNECIQNPCKNGGRCRNEVGHFTCSCAAGFTGALCETSLSSKGFQELSYMEYNSVDAQNNYFVLEFATVKENALLLYNPGQMNQDGGDFIALEIVNGNVRFSFALGDSTPTRITVLKPVSDGTWYRVEAVREKTVGTLKVSSCPEGDARCSSCKNGDSSCYATISKGTFERFDSDGKTLTLGGVKTFSTILQHKGQVSTHDFVGCMRNVSVGGIKLFESEPISSAHILAKCPRPIGGACSQSPCGAKGTCMDEWFKYRCECPEGTSLPNCTAGLRSFSFGPDSLVEYKQKETYQRDQMMAQSSRRRRRDVNGDGSVSLTFMSDKKQGLLFYSASGSDYTILMVKDGFVQYVSKMGSSNMKTLDSLTAVSDSKWHTVTLQLSGVAAILTVDEEKQTEQGPVHNFLGLEMSAMTLGGTKEPLQIGTETIKGFDGCLQDFMLNGKKQPFDGSSARFVASPVGGVKDGCSVMAPLVGDEPLSVGVIVVIVFFALLLVGILVSFIIFRARRLRKKEKAAEGSGGTGTKSNGTIIMANKSANDSGRSYQDSGFTENDELPEDVIIRNHIAEELASQKYNEREIADNHFLSQPDLIGGKNKVPVQMEDGTIIIENGEMLMPEEPPEHYDFENASSIAPSDIDVVHHYRRYRDGIVGNYKANPPLVNYHKHNHRHSPSPNMYNQRRESPLTISRNSPNIILPRESPSVLKMQSTPITSSSPLTLSARQSPMNLPMRGSPLTVNNLARHSPITALQAQHQQQHHRNSPMSHLARQSPTIQMQHMRSSNQPTLPLHHGPHSPIKEMSRTNSDRSLPRRGGYMSNSSLSSREGIMKHGLPPIPNGHVSSRPSSRSTSQAGSRPGSKLRQPIDLLPSNAPPPVGLTVEEVERLNARPRQNSLVSTLDAVSSSSDERLRNNNKNNDVPAPNRLLEPPDSTSDDSSNDSFTCSEFEYDNEKARNDFDPGMMIFSKLAEVENENDEMNDVNRPYGTSENMDHMGGSLSTLLVNDEDFRHKNPNGTFNWDYLLNWGPSFEKLVGVFKDIAQLPDNGTMPVKAENKSMEEYV